MVILMKNDKTLVISKNSRLYQKENAVDKITFYVPEHYEENDLREFVASICYTDPSTAVRSELLVPLDESDKKDFIEYKLPVTTNITALAGTIPLYLSLVHMDIETNTPYVLKTNVVNITVETWENYFKYLDRDSLSMIDNMMLMLDTKIAEVKSISDMYEDSQPDDLTVDENGLLKLTAHGNEIGEGVNVVVNPTDIDDQLDGIIDLDALTGGGSTPVTPTSGLDLTIGSNGLLQVTENGTAVGDGVNVIVNPDDTDGENDGILDLDSLMG